MIEKEKINKKTYGIDIESIYQAKKNIASDVLHTNLTFADHLSEHAGAKVYIKPENTQRVKSFKIRGALNKIKNLSAEEKAKGVIAPSAGNHAQGVALAATLNGVKAVIVMPKNAPEQKVNATRSFGGQVVLADATSFDGAGEEAKRLQKEHGYTLIHAFDDLDVIAGQGTIGLEIMEDLPDTDVIVCPIGGGGLIAGLAIAVKTINPRVRIIGVEPERFDCMKESVDKNKITTVDKKELTLADGCAVKTPGTHTFKIVNDLVDEIVTVNELEIENAMRHLLERCKLVSEGAGALASAAILSNKVKDIKGKKVVSIITGGNVDIDKLLLAIDYSLVVNEARKVLVRFNPKSNKDCALLKGIIDNLHGKAYDLNSQEFKICDDTCQPLMYLNIFFPKKNDGIKFKELVSNTELKIEVISKF